MTKALDFAKGVERMFRKHARLFKTSKALGMWYRLTRNVWWDLYRDLKRIWKEPSGNKKGMEWN